MEMDDAMLADREYLGEQIASPRWLGENGDTSTASRTGQRNGTKTALGVEAEEDPPEHDPPLEQVISEVSLEDGNCGDSLASETALKLEVSATEDEDSRDDGKAVYQTQILAKQNQAPLKKNTKKRITLKRKRFEVRRSGSEECLLGFDEQSGEAELVKNYVDELIRCSSKNVECEDNAMSPITSLRISKKLKPAQVKSVPRNQSSPKETSPQRDGVDKIIKNDEKIKDSPAEHIVADNEETNDTDINTKANLSVHAALQSSMPQLKKPISAQDDFFKKPFEHGWKRELVWRANIEASKDKADVYFITPGGKKLRTRCDILPLLEGDLTIDHFSFAREPLGVGPEFETVRSAKPSSRVSVTAATLAAAPSPSNMGKRISKPKGPKGASPPPQGWTPTRALKVNNAALLSSSSSSRFSGSSSSSGTPPIRLASANSTASSTKSKIKKGAVSISVPTAAEHSNTSISNTLEPCSFKCALAAGQVPQLKCIKCLCLFHHECVGLNPSTCGYRIAGQKDFLQNGREYICEACIPEGEAPGVMNVMNLRKSSAVQPIRIDNKFPQTIAVVKGKKYVMVAKPIAPPIEHVSDIENDLKQINESIRKSRKPSSISLDATLQTHVSPITPTHADQPTKMFATNFFANVSFAYDALLCILKYLKIHERPRAASVCKLWHLAAKDTSLWHTVRMKNSKVSNWSGFAAALRRGETKHLDLRKMLVASTRGEEMWQDFSEHIGTVCSLEIIDLCRCSARVVENLFQSNLNLRILNAVAINDDAINLENINLLTRLEELRLRTCESGIITSNLQPLQALTKLTQLSLTAVRDLGSKGVEVLSELAGLRSLELGECGDFDSTFAKNVLPKLKKLQRIRLENGQETNCCTLEILDAIANLDHLSQLELVNFDIKTGFDVKLYQCTKLRKLLIIPTYISQSATTNHIVLNAVQQVADTLKVFTWGVTVELLRVTALYVDQCEESTKKEKHHFDECIPVLKPVPGAPSADDEDENNDAKKMLSDEIVQSDVPQIEILPLDKVESILGDNLPKTKFTIVKVPYHATCKQQLVE